MIWVVVYAVMALLVGGLVARYEEDPVFGAIAGIFWPFSILGVIGAGLVLLPFALFALLAILIERVDRWLGRSIGPQSRPPQPTPGG